MVLITRASAAASGLKWYFTGIPCSKGHVAERLVSNYYCRECCKRKCRDWRAVNQDYFSSYRIKNADRARQTGNLWRAQNRERVRELRLIRTRRNRVALNAKQIEWRRNNPERVVARRAAYYQRTRDAQLAQHKKWRKANPGIHTALQRKREAMKVRRTPQWADLDSITQFYVKCPKGKTVDHIFPINGKLISGLHVLENLQYLTSSENSKKGNRFVPFSETVIS